MSRSGYTDDMDSTWDLVMWRGAVTSAIRGKRGQAFLREMLAAMDAMPVKELIAEDLETQDGQVCAIGAVGAARGTDMEHVDPEDYNRIAAMFGIAPALAREIMYENDDRPLWDKELKRFAYEDPAHRFIRMRKWIVEKLND